MVSSPLDNLQVASPCKVDWSSMSGDEQVRFCGSCRLNVYNLSGMTRSETEALLNKEGRLCVRFFRRTDGTVLTRDCPIGLERLRWKIRLVWMMTASLLLTVLSAVGFMRWIRFTSEPPRRMEPWEIAGGLLPRGEILGRRVQIPQLGEATNDLKRVKKSAKQPN